MKIVLPKEESSYRVFSSDLEDADHVFFHGTSMDCYTSILENGFERGKITGGTSFSVTSGIALNHACDARADGNAAVVIAVKFKNLQDLAFEGDVVQFYKHHEYNSNSACGRLTIIDCIIVDSSYK